MTSPRTASAVPVTRERLLEAATEVFGAEGYRNARIRDICARADANVAAVNYHFRDKKTLYVEVVDRAFADLAGTNPADLGLGPEASLEQRVHAFVRSLVVSLLANGHAATCARLVAREMIEPHEALDRVIERGIRPQLEVLLQTLREGLGPGADEQHLRRCASSIIGQCVFYYFARHAILQLSLEPHLSTDDVEPIVAHITKFSLAALAGR